MAIWEPIIFIDPNGEQRLILYRLCTHTGIPVFCPDWVENGPQYNFEESDGIRALEQARDRAAAEDTPEGYLKAAKFRDMLNVIKKAA